MVERNALGGGDPPRLFLGRTAVGNRWRFRHDLPDQLVGQLEALCEEEPVAGDLREPPRHAARFSAVLTRCAPIAETWTGPAYRSPPPSLPPMAPLSG